MNGPFHRLRFLPWRSLLQSSGLTVLIISALDGLLIWGLTASPVIHKVMAFLYTPPLGLFISLAGALGIGALAVVILEVYCPRILINAGSLWALVFCLFGLFLLRSLLPLPSLLFAAKEIYLLLLAVGVFWKGRPYWQPF